MIFTRKRTKRTKRTNARNVRENLGKKTDKTDMGIYIPCPVRFFVRFSINERTVFCILFHTFFNIVLWLYFYTRMEYNTGMRDYAESRLQAEIVKALSLLGVYVLMIPNGEITDMSAKKYTRLVALGFRGGMADTMLIERGTGRVFFLEFKRPGGVQSESQVKFEATCAANNWPYAIAESVEEAEAQARVWGLVKNV